MFSFGMICIQNAERKFNKKKLTLSCGLDTQWFVGTHRVQKTEHIKSNRLMIEFCRASQRFLTAAVYSTLTSVLFFKTTSWIVCFCCFTAPFTVDCNILKDFCRLCWFTNKNTVLSRHLNDQLTSFSKII